ncbi:MAG: single-stranded DNA-binding protein [Dehalococcoidia bacterium]
MTLNKILIIGNLGSDPEMRYTPNGNPVTSFTVATNRRYKTAEGEDRDETEWFRVSAWNRLAENCNQFLQRGSKVYVEGRLTSRTYVGNDGETRISLDVNASEVRFLDSRNSSPPSSDAGVQSPTSENSENFDELPW